MDGSIITTVIETVWDNFDAPGRIASVEFLPDDEADRVISPSPGVFRSKEKGYGVASNPMPKYH